MDFQLNGKVALVSGASKGIGKAIAIRLGRAGADVVLNYHSDESGAEMAAATIRKMGRVAIAIQADVSKSEQVETMIDQTTRHFQGKLDILVNNAGIVPTPKPVLDMKNEDWDLVHDTNLKGVFYLSRAASKRMIENGSKGRIISIASGAGHDGRFGQAHYCSSKAGVILFSKTLAIELATYEITVNTISVGFVDVGRQNEPGRNLIRKDIIRRILLGRSGSPDDIANTALFLASEEARWITAADFRVDGGESAGRIPMKNS